MRNPFLTNGQQTRKLSEWRKQFRGLTFEREDVNYNILDCNLQVKEKLINISTTPRREYERCYKQRIRTKRQKGLRVCELAQIKKVNRSTILRHLNKFDIISRTPTLIKFNSKLWSWNPHSINHSSIHSFKRK